MSRIGMLHAWAKAADGDSRDDDATTARFDEGDETGRDGVGRDAYSGIGRPDLLPIIDSVMRNERTEHPGSMIVSAQVAVDAFALRQHIAEALVRLFVACSERHVAAEDPTTSLWSRMTDDKYQRINQLVEAFGHAGHDLGEFGFARLVVPSNATMDDDADRALIERFVHLCAEWLRHAVSLLEPAELDVNTAHNKVKHGLAVRGRADLKVSFSTVGPDAEGNIPLSAFDDDVSFDIVERPVLEFMSRPKLQGLPRPGLEVTQLRLDYRAMLAESALMAYVHAALFYVAASRHFDGRPVPRGLSVAPHPGFAGQDAARPNLGGHQVGLRFPITNPPGGGEARPAGFWHRDGTSVTLNYTGERMTARIVDNSQAPPDRTDIVEVEIDRADEG